MELQGEAEWSAATGCHPGAFMVLQGDGNMVLYTSDGLALWNSDTHNKDAQFLVMQGDGHLVLYRADGTEVWDHWSVIGNYNYNNL